jgi:hypothetical protein
MYRDYWIRCIEADKPLLMELGQVLGMLNAEGGMTSECAVWHEIGPINKPTGETTTDPETGETVDITAPLVDDEGNVYWHYNLTTTVDIRARAEALATEHPALAVALSQMGRFFPVDELGQPRRPASPVCVRAGS